ncbi:unnamed protein product [Rotaria sp. Silwood1]|nr:unnamed protein product [Rotaria sp. Silwood1]
MNVATGCIASLFDSSSLMTDNEYHNQILFLTDAQPNQGNLYKNFYSRIEKLAKHRVYKTFIGVGIDLNTQLLSSITKNCGANYFSVHDSKNFLQLSDKDFCLIVTQLIFNVKMKPESDLFDVEHACGSSEWDKAKQDELIKTTTLFPSRTDDEGYSKPVIVHTQYGDVLGYQTDSARVFYGIPFARPPIGTLRWQPPVPVTKWYPKVINATQSPPACAQPASAITTIVTPSTVSFICVLGFLATGNGSNDIRGNYGILDQRLAIAWIKANIEAFGGDSNEITLFGQSAGAQSIALHYVTNEMQPFFQRAIIQSAPMTVPFRTYLEYVTPSVLFAEQLHCDIGDIACFRNRSTDDIIAAQNTVNGMLTSLNVLLFFEPWLPVIDNVIVHGQLIDTVYNTSFPLKPLIIGTVTEECRDFIYGKWQKPISPSEYIAIALVIFQEKAFKILKKYPPVGSGDQRPLVSRAATQWVFACSTRVFARKGATYSYVFGYPYDTENLRNRIECSDHACHADEIPFLFESSWANFTDAGRRVSQIGSTTSFDWITRIQTIVQNSNSETISFDKLKKELIKPDSDKSTKELTIELEKKLTKAPFITRIGNDIYYLYYFKNEKINTYL